jgi:hypothetical protein
MKNISNVVEKNKTHILYSVTQHFNFQMTHTTLKNVELLKLDFCLTVHHQLGKVIQMNQLDGTMIY